jgi:plastin-1
LNTLRDLAVHTQVEEIQDDHILAWANGRVQAGGKASSISSFKDSTIRSSLFLLDLVSVIAPESIQTEMIIASPDTPEDRLLNAKYLLSIAMKIGASVFISAEDITEVKSKMIMSLLSSLWVVDVAREEVNTQGGTIL